MTEDAQDCSQSPAEPPPISAKTPPPPAQKGHRTQSRSRRATPAPFPTCPQVVFPASFGEGEDRKLAPFVQGPSGQTIMPNFPTPPSATSRGALFFGGRPPAYSPLDLVSQGQAPSAPNGTPSDAKAVVDGPRVPFTKYDSE